MKRTSKLILAIAGVLAALALIFASCGGNSPSDPPSTPDAATPTASPNGGAFFSLPKVTLASATDGAYIYYTTDGTAPVVAGESTSFYQAPFAVPSWNSVVKAIAVKNGYNNSGVLTTAAYTQDARIVASITVTQPTKTTYLVGEALDLAGLVVTATFNDGTTGFISVSPADTDWDTVKANPGAGKTVTINVNGKTAAFTVNIITAVTVTYNLNYAGAPAAEVKTIVPDSLAPTVTAPTRGGYTFSGWYQNAAGTGAPWNFSATPVSANTILYAKWEASGPSDPSLSKFEGLWKTVDGKYDLLFSGVKLVRIGHESDPSTIIEAEIGTFTDTDDGKIEFNITSYYQYKEGIYADYPTSVVENLSYTLSDSTLTITGDPSRIFIKDGSTVDKYALQIALIEAQLVDADFRYRNAFYSVDGADVFESKYWFTIAEQSAFGTAYTTAKAIRNNPAATALEVTSALTALTTAFIPFTTERKPGKLLYYVLPSPTTVANLNDALKTKEKVKITVDLTLSSATISMGATTPAKLSVGTTSGVTFPANTVFDTTTNTIDIGDTTNLVINTSSIMTLTNGAGIKAGGLVIRAAFPTGSNDVEFSGLAAGNLIESGVLTVHGTAKVEATGSARIQAGDDTNYVRIQGGILNPLAAVNGSVVVDGNAGVLYLSPSGSAVSSIFFNSGGSTASAGTGKIQFGTGEGKGSITGSWSSSGGATTLSVDNSGNIEIKGAAAARFLAQNQSRITVAPGAQLSLAENTTIDLAGSTAASMGSIVLMGNGDIAPRTRIALKADTSKVITGNTADDTTTKTGPKIFTINNESFLLEANGFVGTITNANYFSQFTRKSLSTNPVYLSALGTGPCTFAANLVVVDN
ncbi:chitobiase/beta-hexosaminidase C-terminal domain-containing protein [Leadbettera azotonutricia]|uniref:Repeat protein n=1 Tax=Leadbettera azotonutricia (strain ATCC BAA-888 / DSM 13862 / ZAS-9) TaxID=545695 RepID=F5Y935_LEAAZ|nr:chitobiase/beta-hexosaminidase C-terminal domain-containing protein [Leadbettera azotonutricia]AEF82807.1 repeat protein [Leadbettera azotonutricia ZAS-9]